MSKIIEMKNIRKEFPGVVALNDINFDIKSGEVHVLVGENGAGKSTLMKILSGVHEPTEGTMTIGGHDYSKITPKEAIEKGISVIFQELSIIDELSIAENLFVGDIPVKKILGMEVVDYKFINNTATELLKRVGLNIHPSVLVESLSISDKQLVEIAKALAYDTKVLIMDEPTSSLNTEEVSNLFEIINQLTDEGVGIVYISHKMSELREIGDRITVIKDGETVGTKLVKDFKDDEEIVSMMVGRELTNTNFNKEHSTITENIVFEAKNISTPDGKVNNVDFKLYEGEILGFAGLVGAGRTELMNAIYGGDYKDSGEMILQGKTINVKSPYESIKEGICMITEDRRETGFISTFTIEKNLTLPLSLKESKLKGTWGLLNRKQERIMAQEYIEKMNVRCTSIDQDITQLSGGNQQKVIIGKWLATDSKLIIFDEPTRGIDVGSKNEIYHIMRGLANNGRGVIMVSSELTELLQVCDRIIVVADGKVQKTLSAYEATEENIMLAATKNA